MDTNMYFESLKIGQFFYYRGRLYIRAKFDADPGYAVSTKGRIRTFQNKTKVQPVSNIYAAVMKESQEK